MTGCAKSFKAAALLCRLSLILLPFCEKKKAEEGAGFQKLQETSLKKPETMEKPLYVFAGLFIYDSRSLTLTPSSRKTGLTKTFVSNISMRTGKGRRGEAGAHCLRPGKSDPSDTGQAAPYPELDV